MTLRLPCSVSVRFSHLFGRSYVNEQFEADIAISAGLVNVSGDIEARSKHTASILSETIGEDALDILFLGCMVHHVEPMVGPRCVCFLEDRSFAEFPVHPPATYV